MINKWFWNKVLCGLASLLKGSCSSFPVGWFRDPNWSPDTISRLNNFLVVMMEDKELLQPWLAPHQPQVSGAVCAALYSVSHHSFEISHCNFGPEVIATTSVIPMSPEHNLRIHVRTVFYVVLSSSWWWWWWCWINIAGVKPPSPSH